MEKINSRIYETRNTRIDWYKTVPIYCNDIALIYLALEENGVAINKGSWMNDDRDEDYHFGEYNTSKSFRDFCLNDFNENTPVIDYIDMSVSINDEKYKSGFNFSKDKFCLVHNLVDKYDIEGILANVEKKIIEEREKNKSSKSK